jgi:putative transposase
MLGKTPAQPTTLTMFYRRANIKGATYFITVNLEDRRSNLLTTHIDLLRNAFRLTKARHAFVIDALVILPDHFHLLMTLPVDDANFSQRISTIKSAFSKHLPKHEPINTSRSAKRERGIWQRRFWEHMIRDDADFASHVDYIHINPVKHSHVQRAVDWPYSSIHRYIAEGQVDANWATGEGDSSDTDFGEGRG